MCSAVILAEPANKSAAFLNLGMGLGSPGPRGLPVAEQESHTGVEELAVLLHHLTSWLP